MGKRISHGLRDLTQCGKREYGGEINATWDPLFISSQRPGVNQGLLLSNSQSSESDRQLHRVADCGSISRMNNALFNPRIHFECPTVKRGRYVYVKASGVEDRWRSIFSVVLCEIMVY